MPEHGIEVGRRQEQAGGVDALLFEDLRGGFAFFGIVGSGEVPPALIGPGFFEEVGAVAESFEVKELGLDEVVGAFHIGVGVGGGRGQEAVVGEEVLDEGMVAPVSFLALRAAELASVVGGEDDLLQRDVPLFQVLEDSL